MSEDASLDDFLDAEDEEDGDVADDEEGASVASADGVPDSTSDGNASGTLDAADGSEGGRKTTDAPTEDGGDGEAADDEPGDVEPPSSTAAWSEEPSECADCGTTVRRRWRDGDDLVCDDCKEW